MLVWAEGFEHYGTGGTANSNMVDGAWATSNVNVDPAFARNGTYGCGIGGNQGMRRTFGETKDVVGVGQALRLGNLPSESNLTAFCQMLDFDANSRGCLTISTDGRIQYRSTSNNSGVVAQSDQVIFAGAYQWIESRWDFINGTIEVRVDNVTVLDLTGLSLTACSQMAWVCGFPGFYEVDDIVVWDDQGDYANDFIGDHRARLAALIEDTAQADWEPSVASATGVEMIDEIPPVDTDYIEAAEPYMASEFIMDETPADVSSILGVIVIGRQLKTEAGDCSTQLSLVSGASEGLGTERPLSLLPTYYQDAFVVDPNTGAPFEPANVGGDTGCRFKITRTV